jgi:hypothetical protein
MSDPATSFVLPVYNAAPLLAETIDTILGQTDHDFELIIVDDGSTDATPQLLATRARTDPRVRVITQPNAGITRALITGCKAARGKYIARHDAGDLSDPKRLAVQRAMLDARDDLVFVSCWTQITGPELEPLYVLRGPGRAAQPADILDVTQRFLVIDGPTHHGSVVFCRDAYERAGGYRAEFYYGQDWDLWYRLAAIGKFQMAEEVLYTARVMPGSISSSAKAGQEEIAVHTHDAVRARARGESDAIYVERASSVRPARSKPTRCALARGLYFIGEALRRNRDARCRRYLRDAVLACPMMLRAWMRLLQSALRL